MQRMEQIISDGRTLMFVSHGASSSGVFAEGNLSQPRKNNFRRRVNDAMAAYAVDKADERVEADL
jgi:hypothetical protein